MRIWWRTFLHRRHLTMKLVSCDWFESYGKGGGGCSLTETALKKEKQRGKKLTNTYIFVSAFRLNLCFSSISFPKTNMVTEHWTNMSHMLSSRVEGVEGDTRISPFQVFITGNLLMMLMKCALVFSSGVPRHLLLSALNITHPSLLKCQNEFGKRTAFGATEWEVTTY